jgi:hypothetical protein
LQIFEAIKAGKDALDEIHKEMSLDAVEKLLQETEDAMALQKYVLISPIFFNYLVLQFSDIPYVFVHLANSRGCIYDSCM